MLPQSYKISHGLCLNNFPQVSLIGNQRDPVPLFIYVNQADEVSHFVRRRKVIQEMKCLMISLKQSLEEVEIWAEQNWEVKRVNSLYNIVSGRFN